MKHQFPHIFKVTTDFGTGDGVETQFLTVMVVHDKTRTGKWVVKAKIDWHEDWSTYYVLGESEFGTHEESSSTFWSRTRYVALQALFNHNCLEDSVLSHDFEGERIDRIQDFLKSIPPPTDFPGKTRDDVNCYDAYFGALQRAFPEIELVHHNWM